MKHSSVILVRENIIQALAKVDKTDFILGGGTIVMGFAVEEREIVLNSEYNKEK